MAVMTFCNKQEEVMMLLCDFLGRSGGNARYEFQTAY
jgi:hypothetical protein